MTKKQQKYDVEYKIQVIKLVQEIGSVKAHTLGKLPYALPKNWQTCVNR
ncbi:transposase [Megasphaera cerevisiae]|jgi:hypothetical protein|nr:transposase [Megasphaera cerevisiae]SJZ97778.1 hypothetical protein SAMN05660900_02015 [Megasphaera cerevisiae DSM 20462]